MYWNFTFCNFKKSIFSVLRISNLGYFCSIFFFTKSMYVRNKWCSLHGSYILYIDLFILFKYYFIFSGRGEVTPCTQRNCAQQFYLFIFAKLNKYWVSRNLKLNKQYFEGRRANYKWYISLIIKIQSLTSSFHFDLLRQNRSLTLSRLK